MRLRALARGGTTALAVLAIGTAGALAVLTSCLHRAVESVASASTAARSAEGMHGQAHRYQRWLLLHATTGLPEAAEQQTLAASAVAKNAAELRGSAAARQHPDLVAAAIAAMEAYQAARQQVDRVTAARLATEGDPAFDATARAIRRIVDASEQDMKQAVRYAAALDGTANVIAAVTSITSFLLIAALVMRARSQLYEPLLRMERAAASVDLGERDAQMPEQGADELRDLARTFNATTATMRRQVGFMASVVHDLRNPLAAMKAAAQTIGRTDDPERVHRMSEVVERQLVRLERMLGDLLDAARLEVGELALDLRPCDLGAVAQRCVDAFRGISPQHDIRIELDDADLHVECDSGRIEQALENVVANAVKYSPKGGVVDVRVRAFAACIEVSVRDRGVGIAPEDLHAIFEPFRRSVGVQTSLPGAGLGLWVVRRIVEGHGGHVAVESALGVGSTFRIVLPRTPRTAPELVPRPA